MTDDNTRPISVAELLARNGTIGSPPVSGHRRRKRRNAVSVAELTGEIPVVNTGEVPVVTEEEAVTHDEAAEAYAEPESAETVIVYTAADEAESADVTADEVETAEADYTYASDDGYTDDTDYSDAPDYTPEYGETATVDADAADDVLDDSLVIIQPDDSVYEQAAVAEDAVEESADESAVIDAVDVVHDAPEPIEPVVVEDTEVSAPQPVVSSPPRSSIPLPRRRRGPERSHDPRPRRRSSGAEQMSYDPVDEAVDLSELVAEQAPDPEELRSYLQSSSGTLFSGETVADDLARRGLVSDDNAYNDEDYEQTEAPAEPRRGALSVVGNSVVAILQSLLAVVFGAGLFIAFDQLWRWNNIVALALSTLVIVALVIGVHVVRKTEDFVSILIAVAVGIMVTFGPLALQST